MTLEDELRVRFATPHDRAFLNIVFTGAWLTARFNRFLKGFGLSEQQFNVLRILRGQKGKPANLSLIQERMVHRMSNVTRLVERLREKGLVERVVCEGDRRRVEITITEEGLKLLSTMAEAQREHMEELVKRITGEEAKTLGDLLEKVRDWEN